MSMAENIRTKAEEIKGKVRTRIEELRTGASTGHSPLLGGLGLGKGTLMKGPLVTEIKEKGVMATARARIEKIRGGGGLLAGSSSSIAEKPTVEKDAGALKQYRGKLAIEA